MGKKGGSAPKAPDPYETAAAESQFNRLDTYGPTGTGVRYGYTDANGNFVQGLAPQGMQSAVQQVEGDFDRQIREMLEPASQALTSRVIADNITGMPDAARVRDRGTVAQDIFDRNLSMMMPEITRGENRLLTNLQARGLPIGSEAFNEAYGAQQRQTQDTISRLAQDANVAAGAEQSRLFSLDSAARQNSIAELVAAMGGGYNPASGVPSGAAPNVNYSGLVGDKYQADLAQYNADRQAGAQTAGALGSLGGALLMKGGCSIEIKDIEGAVNTEYFAAVIRQIPLAVWRYKQGQAPFGYGREPHVGPMAEHFHQFTGLGDGKTIDFIDMFGTLAAALQHALRQNEQLSERIAALEGHALVNDALVEAREAAILRKVS